MRCFSRGRRHVPSRDGGRGEEEMPPVKTREPLIEEKVFGGISKGWAYLVYAIRQIIIFFPSLWAGYEYGRRKEERMKKLGKQMEAEKLEEGQGKMGLCAIHGVNWTEVEELWDMDVEMVEAVIGDIIEEVLLLPDASVTTPQ
jgi:hypothetical protein